MKLYNEFLLVNKYNSIDRFFTSTLKVIKIRHIFPELNRNTVGGNETEFTKKKQQGTEEQKSVWECD